MPPKVANKGGRRGRPPAASRLRDASQAQHFSGSELPQDLNDELSFEDQSTPKDGVAALAKVGQAAPTVAEPGSRQPKRPRTITANASEPQPIPRGTSPAPRTTKGQRRKDEVTHEPVDSPGSASDGQRRFGRVDDGDPAPAIRAATGPPGTTSPAPKRKPGRPPKLIRKEPSVEDEVAEPPGKRKRGRPSLQNVSGKTDGVPPQETTASAIKGKRKAPASERDQATNVDAEPPLKRPRQRKRAGAEQSTPAAEPPRSRGRPRTSTSTAPDSSTKSTKRKASAANNKRHKRDAPTDTAPAASPVHQQPGVAGTKVPAPPAVEARRISDKPTTIAESVVRETWSPLDASSVALATSHLDLASRPVLQYLATNAKRQGHVADILRKVSSIIARRLRHFPLPPALAHKPGKRGGGRGRGVTSDPRDDELSHERVLGTIKALQRSLDTLLDSRRLLEAERDHQQAALEKEYAELDRLEGNARSEVRGLREQLRKAHPLVPEVSRQVDNVHKDASVRPVADDGLDGALFHDMDSVQLSGLGTQLANHMESLRANLGQLNGVVPEIMQSRAALRDLLANHLESEQLEHVILG